MAWAQREVTREQIAAAPYRLLSTVNKIENEITEANGVSIWEASLITDSYILRVQSSGRLVDKWIKAIEAVREFKPKGVKL